MKPTNLILGKISAKKALSENLNKKATIFQKVKKSAVLAIFFKCLQTILYFVWLGGLIFSFGS